MWYTSYTTTMIALISIRSLVSTTGASYVGVCLAADFCLYGCLKSQESLAEDIEHLLQHLPNTSNS